MRPSLFAKFLPEGIDIADVGVMEQAVSELSPCAFMKVDGTKLVREKN